MRLFLVLLCLLAPPAEAQSEEEVSLVYSILHAVNPESITLNREICGYLLRNPSGELEISKASLGEQASCATGQVPEGWMIVASWHTHAAWSLGYDGELPSILDVESNMALGIDGYVATPGGRMWFINGQTGRLYQTCGLGCLPSDPNFQPGVNGAVAQSYSLGQLRRRLSGASPGP